MFQSAPLTEARGDFDEPPGVGFYHRFNPLPSPKQGEIPSVASQHHRMDSFNPLPSPKQGEMSELAMYPRVRSSFNPLPSPKQGEIFWQPKRKRP